MKRLTIFIALLVVVAFALGIWWKNGTLPANAKDKTSQIFVIGKGEGMRKISNDLKEKGLVRDPIVFFLLTKKLGLDKKIQAGDFRLNPSMSADEVAQTLTHGTLDIWITIPEGTRASEISDALKDKMPNYKSSWRTVLMANEGYLFPDTYLLPRDAGVNQIVSIMRNNFENKIQRIQKSKTSTLTQNDAVIVASLVEREAKFAEDRPLVASVIINRLNLGMALQIDATVQYVLGYQQNEKTWWKKTLTHEDLKIDSPYNTYVNPGLPPAPISNPGSLALEAALNPADTNYLYYVSDKSGHLHFAKTLDEQTKNIQKYLQ